jgi:release factor glutamine methyltransferase
MPAPIEDHHFADGSPLDLRSALKLGIARLRAERVPSDTLAAELLLLHATSRSRTWIYSHPEEALSDSERAAYFALIEKRAAGIPTQHLTGEQEFWGLPLEVTPEVLIPRPETEHLVEVALDRLALADLRARGAQNMSGEGLLIADIGTGSGCLAIALAKELPQATIYAVDISTAALAVAHRNASRLGLSGRIHCVPSDLFSAFSPGTLEAAPPARGWLFDLVVSNPPYIGRREAAHLPREVRDHEPELALYGGEEGCELYAGLVAESAAHLRPGGILVLELGHDSLAAVRPLFDSPGWTSVGITADLAGIPRVLSAERS